MDVTREDSQRFAKLPQVSLQNEHRNSILMTCHYPDLGSASDWLKQTSYTAQPIRSTTHIRDGISALDPHTAFCGKTSGHTARCQLPSCRRPPLQ